MMEDSIQAVDREKLLETVTQTAWEANAGFWGLFVIYATGLTILAANFVEHHTNAISEVFVALLGAGCAWLMVRLNRDRRHGISYTLYSDRLEMSRGGRTKVVRLDQILDIKLRRVETDAGPTGSYRLRALNGEVHRLPMTEEMGRLVKRMLHVRDTRDTTWFEPAPPKPEEPKYRTEEESYVPYQLQSKRLEEWRKDQPEQ